MCGPAEGCVPCPAWATLGLRVGPLLPCLHCFQFPPCTHCRAKARCSWAIRQQSCLQVSMCSWVQAHTQACTFPLSLVTSTLSVCVRQVPKFTPKFMPASPAPEPGVECQGSSQPSLHLQITWWELLPLSLQLTPHCGTGSLLGISLTTPALQPRLQLAVELSHQHYPAVCPCFLHHRCLVDSGGVLPGLLFHQQTRDSGHCSWDGLRCSSFVSFLLGITVLFSPVSCVWKLLLCALPPVFCQAGGWMCRVLPSWLLSEAWEQTGRSSVLD